MNEDIIKANWKELKGKVKQQWSKLTNDDLSNLDGTWDELEGNLQKRYGYGKDQVKNEINEFLRKAGFDIKEETNAFREDFQRIRSKAAETKDSIVEAAQHMGSRAEDLFRGSMKDFQEKGTVIQENVVEYVKANPVKSIAWAVGAGLLIARLLSK